MLKDYVASAFGGMIKYGAHNPGNVGCGLEILSAYHGRQWSDSPTVNRIWDLRPLNDVIISDSVRAECLIPVLEAYDGCLDWPLALQWKVSDRLVVSTVNRLVANSPGNAIREQCRSAGTFEEALAAAKLTKLETTYNASSYTVTMCGKGCIRGTDGSGMYAIAWSMCLPRCVPVVVGHRGTVLGVNRSVPTRLPSDGL